MFASKQIPSNKNMPLKFVPSIYLVDAHDLLCDKSICYRKYISQLSKQLAINICSEYLAVPKKELHISKNKYGKPYIAEKPDFFFNISHSGRWFGCAVANHNIGFDIQEIVPKYLNLVTTKLFSKSEIEYINFNKEETNYRFFKIWGAKESFVKCIGTGFYTPLSSFTVDNKMIKYNGKNYYLYYPHAPNNYVLTVCTATKICDFEVHYKPINEVVHSLKVQ